MEPRGWDQLQRAFAVLVDDMIGSLEAEWSFTPNSDGSSPLNLAGITANKAYGFWEGLVDLEQEFLSGVAEPSPWGSLSRPG